MWWCFVGFNETKHPIGGGVPWRSLRRNCNATHKSNTLHAVPVCFPTVRSRAHHSSKRGGTSDHTLYGPSRLADPMTCKIHFVRQNAWKKRNLHSPCWCLDAQWQLLLMMMMMFAVTLS